MLSVPARAALAEGWRKVNAVWREHGMRLDEPLPEPIEIRTCAGCGGRYWAYATNQTHCSLWCAYPYFRR